MTYSCRSCDGMARQRVVCITTNAWTSRYSSLEGSSAISIPISTLFLFFFSLKYIAVHREIALHCLLL